MSDIIDITLSHNQSHLSQREIAKKFFNQNTSTKSNTYQNKFYLCLEVTIGTGTTFDESLHENLKLDCITDVYLTNFTTFNCLKGNVFKLTTNELFYENYHESQINNVVITNLISNTTSNEPVIHLATEKIHITTLTPQTISKISGSISDSSSSTIGRGATSKFNLTLLFVLRNS